MSEDEAEVCIYEVGPRDGLQNERDSVSTQFKLALIDRLASAGLRRIEVTSFVSPDWIPQLADADAVAEGLPAAPGVRYSALVPNAQGYERFRASGRIGMAAVFISVSETHNRKNVNRSVADHLERLRVVADLCQQDAVPLRAYVSTAFGCAMEGPIEPSAVAGLAHALSQMGTAEISLGDTVGVGHPRAVREVVEAVAERVSLDVIALHFHDTYGRGLANVQAGFESGVRTFDASIGGLGGCPYAPGAAGNVATEDVVALFDAAGVSTGINLDRLVDSSRWLESEALARPLSSRVYRAVVGAREEAGLE